MKTSTILRCTCDHADQDKLHGKGNRVFTKKKQRDTNNREWRCTVCGSIKTA